MKAEITRAQFNEWSRIEIWDAETVGSPETLMIAKALYEWYVAHGCDIAAIVVCNELQRYIVKEILCSKVEIFSKLSDAQVWLYEQQTNSVNRVALTI